MKMQDWVQEMDNQILMNRRKILEGNGKISHEEAISKAEKEFKIKCINKNERIERK